MLFCQVSESSHFKLASQAVLAGETGAIPVAVFAVREEGDDDKGEKGEEEEGTEKNHA